MNPLAMFLFMTLFTNARKPAEEQNVRVLHENSLNTIQKGEDFAVLLEENASTGYHWQYHSSDPAAFSLVSITEVTEKPRPDFVGAPSQKAWTFSADKMGRFELEFRLLREGEAPVDVKTYEILTIAEKYKT